MTKIKILVVEDSSIVALDIQHSLQNLGYEVIGIASSGEEALKKVRKTLPDLILMDIKIDGKYDGIETAARIKENHDIPIIYLTAYSDQDTLTRAKITEPLGYIIKPFEEQELHTVIEVAVYKHQMDIKLKDSEKWLGTTLQSIGDAVIATDGLGCIKFMNPIAEELTGWTQQDAYNLPLKEIFYIVNETTGLPVNNPVQKVFELGTIVGLANHTILINKHGQSVPIDDSAAPIKDDNGDIIGVVLVFRDVSERRKTEQNLKISEKRFRQLVNSFPDLILRIDKDGFILDYKPPVEFLAPIPADEILGKNIEEFFQGEFYDLFKNNTILSIQTAEPILFEYDSPQMDKTDKRTREARIVPISQDEAMIIIRDITERKKMEEQLKYLSLHDPLTGIYNRTYFEEEMKRLDSTRHLKLGVIICDLDGLKLVNDTLGHERGDALLVAAAQVIKDSIRLSDLAARIGGDEFAILVYENESIAVEKIYQRIREGVTQYNNEYLDLPLSISVGFAVNNKKSLNATSVFKEADDNMYREKLYRSRSTRSTIVQAMMKVLEIKDFFTEGHVQRLQHLIVSLAEAIDLPEPSITNLRLLAQFHDIGKVGTPDQVLFKPAKLTSEETSEMQRHAEIGHRIAQSIPELLPVADWILKHHEWWNGKGYPLGLKEEEIPIESRILAIADAYDAMTFDRPYRKAVNHEEAIAEIRRFSGIQFDPNLVEKFIAIFEKKASACPK